MRISVADVLLPTLTTWGWPVRKSKIQLQREVISPRVLSIVMSFVMSFDGNQTVPNQDPKDKLEILDPDPLSISGSVGPVKTFTREFLNPEAPCLLLLYIITVTFQASGHHVSASVG